ncbi:MAG: DUF2125 domain-containing protein [Caulobacterales bacterium]|nr:DUF2125 domain-containing protein [Caulobacterales bacterium]
MARRSGCGIPALFVLILVVVGGWSGYWWYLSNQIRTNLATTGTRLEAAGWTFEHAEPRIAGWPFRFHVTLDDLTVTGPSGHGFRTGHLEAEANAYGIDHWVFVAPEGLELGRGSKGWVAVEGRALRASASGLLQRPPRIVIEFIQPRFAPTEGSQPFPITQAERLVVNLVPQADQPNRAGLLFDLTQATPRPGGVLAEMSERRPIELSAEAVIDNTQALSGSTWREALTGWSQAGGGLSEVRLEATAGDDFARGQSDRLTVGSDGRLQGQLAGHLRGGTAPLAGLAHAPGVDPRAAAAVTLGAQLTSGFRGETELTLNFSNGRTIIGPVSLGPAPRLF